MELLDEGKDRALKIFEERLKAGGENQKVQIKEEDLEHAAEVLGISSIKYYDLKQNRTQNYVFDFDKMLDPKGNTGVYLIYSYVRIKSILRKAGFDADTSNLDDFTFTVSNEQERQLAITLLRLPEAIDAAARDLMINRVTDQLYDISNKVNDFYGASKVIGSEEQNSRIALLLATAKVMEVCFHLLGMKKIERI